MSLASQEDIDRVVTAIDNIVNAVAGLVGVKGVSGAAIASGANPLPVQLSDGAAVFTGAKETGGNLATVVSSLASLLTATKSLAGFETLTAIDYSGGDQTGITDGSNGIWINTAGTLKVDTWGGATGATFTVVVGLFPLRRVKKIYQTGSDTAAGYVGYPPG